MPDNTNDRQSRRHFFVANKVAIIQVRERRISRHITYDCSNGQGKLFEKYLFFSLFKLALL